MIQRNSFITFRVTFSTMQCNKVTRCITQTCFSILKQSEIV